MINLFNNEKLVKRIMNLRKIVSWRFMHSYSTTELVFIMGCGRSGTSMMLNILNLDHRIETHGEHSKKVFKNFLLEKEKLQSAIDDCKVRILAIKPILNSFEALNYLKEYEKLQVIWMIRDYKDMVYSSINKFGVRVSNLLKDVVLHNRYDNWLSAISESDLNILRSIDTSRFSDYDWMCLVWWSVNRVIISNELYKNKRFNLFNYDYFVQNPQIFLSKLYKKIGVELHPEITKYVNTKSLNRGAKIKINAVPKQMCDKLHKEIELSTSLYLP